MKNIKTRIAAAACAAITAVCGMQAMSASAFNYGHPYTVNSQEWCYRNTGRSLRMWTSDTSSIKQGKTWNGTINAGTMVGMGFTTKHDSDLTNGQKLTGDAAFARYLACSHFGVKNGEDGKAAWIDLPKTQFTAYGHYDFGDQIRLGRGNERHSIFVTYATLNTKTNVTEITCAEVVGKTINWNVKYQMIRYNNKSNTYFSQMKRVSDGKTYDVICVTRPVKEGDANGDGSVTRNDVQWIQNRVKYNGGNPNVSGCNNDLRKTAADVDGTGWLTNDDANIIYSHMYESWGIMMGDYRYALAKW